MKKKLKLRIPETLNEITLGQYQNWIEVATKEGNANTYFLKQKTIEIFCHVPLKFVATIAHKTVETLYDQLIAVLSEVDRYEKSEREKFFDVNGVKYGFIPDFESMTSGEFADLEENVSSFKTWDKAMAVLYRPVTMEMNGKYLIEDYDGITNDGSMKNTPLTITVKALFFLISSQKILGKSLVNYLREETQVNPVLNKISTSDLDGIIHSLQLLSTTQLNWMRLPILISEQCSPTSSTQKRKLRLKKTE